MYCNCLCVRNKKKFLCIGMTPWLRTHVFLNSYFFILMWWSNFNTDAQDSITWHEPPPVTTVSDSQEVHTSKIQFYEGSINEQLNWRFSATPVGGGEGVEVLPYKGLMGTCGQPGYVFRDFCLKQGIEFIIFCLNQGIDLSIFVLNRISFPGR